MGQRIQRSTSNQYFGKLTPCHDGPMWSAAAATPLWIRLALNGRDGWLGCAWSPFQPKRRRWRRTPYRRVVLSRGIAKVLIQRSTPNLQATKMDTHDERDDGILAICFSLRHSSLGLGHSPARRLHLQASCPASSRAPFDKRSALRHLSILWRFIRIRAWRTPAGGRIVSCPSS